MRLLVCDPISPTSISKMREAGIDVDVDDTITAERLEAVIGGYDAIVVRSRTKVRAPLLEKATRLKTIIRGGVGLDNIDVDYAESKGITVHNTAGASSNAVAELTLGYLLGSISFTAIFLRFFATKEQRDEVEHPAATVDEEGGTPIYGAYTTGRIWGPKVGILVSALDMLKVALPMWIFKVYLFPGQPYFLLVSIGGLLGHNWPIYFRFKGGRGVAVIFASLFVIVFSLLRRRERLSRIVLFSAAAQLQQRSLPIDLYLVLIMALAEMNIMKLSSLFAARLPRLRFTCSGQAARQKIRQSLRD